MDRVVPFRQRPVGVDQLHGADPQALLFEPLDDAADEPPLDCIGFQENQSFLHVGRWFGFTWWGASLCHGGNSWVIRPVCCQIAQASKAFRVIPPAHSVTAIRRVSVLATGQAESR